MGLSWKKKKKSPIWGTKVLYGKLTYLEDDNKVKIYLVWVWKWQILVLT